jgi:hypothetical protein
MLLLLLLLLLLLSVRKSPVLEVFIALSCRKHETDPQTQEAEPRADTVRHDQKPVVRRESVREP